ncbi:MAG: O-methyltransferase [Candidatus Eremiobacteraeota bacterium]|nr:O-methyltransferase [Candidatus Eremiobacteraeota bacterium]MBV8531436.1 O-methyltransferase [Candidatus Eremiobacteraeota bacterium]
MHQILHYLERIHPQPHPLLVELEEQGLRDGVPIVSRETGRFLSSIVAAMQATRILEIGTAYGYSTLWMAFAQPSIGRIWTIDSDSRRTAVALSYFKRAEEDDFIEVFNTPALDLLENFPHRNLDLVFIDADKSEYRRYLTLVLPMLKLSGIVIVDDCLLGGRIASERGGEADEEVLAMREFNDYFLNRADLDATILPLGNGTGIGARTR